MHGQSVAHSWTQLEFTASAGDTYITVVDPTGWQVSSTNSNCKDQLFLICL